MTSLDALHANHDLNDTRLDRIRRKKRKKEKKLGRDAQKDILLFWLTQKAGSSIIAFDFAGDQKQG